MGRAAFAAAINGLYIKHLHNSLKVLGELQIGMGLALGKAHVLPVSDDDF